MFLSIQSQLSVKLLKSNKNKEFPPALALVNAGTSITEAEESLKLKLPSSRAGIATIRLVLQKTAAGLKGNHETSSTLRRTLLGVKPQKRTLGYLCQRGRNLDAEAGRKLPSSLADPSR